MVAMSPKAIRFIEVASREFPFQPGDKGAAFDVIEQWRSSYKPQETFTPREMVEISPAVAGAFLSMIEGIALRPARITGVPGWDENDLEFLINIGASIRSELHPSAVIPA